MKHSNIGHRPFILSAIGAVITTIVIYNHCIWLHLLCALVSSTSVSYLTKMPLPIHSLAVLVIYAIYYGIVKSARRWITHLDDKVTKANQALDEQKKQLKLETYQHQQTNVELHKLRTQDPLTELYNQSHFVQLLHNEIARFRRYESEFSLLVIAID